MVGCIRIHMQKNQYIHVNDYFVGIFFFFSHSLLFPLELLFVCWTRMSSLHSWVSMLVARQCCLPTSDIHVDGSRMYYLHIIPNCDAACTILIQARISINSTSVLMYLFLAYAMRWQWVKFSCMLRLYKSIIEAEILMYISLALSRLWLYWVLEAFQNFVSNNLNYRLKSQKLWVILIAM